MNTKFAHTILHIDADAFFVSCEEASRPDLKGKAVVTGLERGVISALNYKAKACGLKRAMSVREAKRICPDLVFLAGDYRTYSLYSQRMNRIVRRFCDNLEEYSIDECFVDLSGFNNSENLAFEIKKTLDKELGFNFSLGLAPTKVLAKIASNWQKPDGLTIIRKEEVSSYLRNLDLEKIWGIGSKTKARLNSLGINTALDLAQKSYDFIKQLEKPYREIWHELRAEPVYLVNKQKKFNNYSISKTKTFKNSCDYNYIFSHLSQNLENACAKLRSQNLFCQKVYFFLKSSDLKIYDYKFCLNLSTNNPLEILKQIDKYLPLIFNSKLIYRATGVVLFSLYKNTSFQPDLFGQSKKEQKISKLFKEMDKTSKRYGKATVFLSSSLKAKKDLKVEEKILNIPYLGKCY